jgi:hypothetical protein
MDEEELPRSAVSLVRELFEEVLDRYEGTRLDYRRTGHDPYPAWDGGSEIAEYRRRFAEIEKNLYSGPNSGR